MYKDTETPRTASSLQNHRWTYTQSHTHEKPILLTRHCYSLPHIAATYALQLACKCYWAALESPLLGMHELPPSACRLSNDMYLRLCTCGVYTAHVHSPLCTCGVKRGHRYDRMIMTRVLAMAALSSGCRSHTCVTLLRHLPCIHATRLGACNTTPSEAAYPWLPGQPSAYGGHVHTLTNNQARASKQTQAAISAMGASAQPLETTV